MSDLQRYDVIIILGGGVTPEGSLTDLSRQKLDGGYLAFQENMADTIIVAGSKEYSVGLRQRYLLEKEGGQKSISLENIIQAVGGQDTIGEAFATKGIIQERGLRNFLLVTSDKHMPRALWIFTRIYGNGFNIEGKSVPCGDLLNEDMERKLLRVTKEFFGKFPGQIDAPELAKWYQENEELYDRFRKIHRRFYPPREGKECQAYMRVDYMKEKK